jgi:predicted patatin/cPLA2 family phospholipase
MTQSIEKMKSIVWLVNESDQFNDMYDYYKHISIITGKHPDFYENINEQIVDVNNEVMTFLTNQRKNMSKKTLNNVIDYIKTWIQ